MLLLLFPPYTQWVNLPKSFTSIVYNTDVLGKRCILRPQKFGILYYN